MERVNKNRARPDWKKSYLKIRLKLANMQKVLRNLTLKTLT